MKYILVSCISGLFFISCNSLAPGKNQAVDEREVLNTSPLMASMSSSTEKMVNLKISEDTDYDFASRMILQHQAAIDMSNIEIEKGKDTAILRLARSIKLSHASEINSMEGYLRVRKDIDGINLDEPLGPEASKLLEHLIISMKAVPMSGDIDKDYSALLISHHEVSIAIANELLVKGQSAEMKQLAGNIIQSHQARIDFSRKWLAVH